MKLLELCDRHSEGRQIKVLAIFAAGGLLTAGIVAVVNTASAVGVEVHSLLLGVLFLAVLLLMWWCNRIASRLALEIFEDAQRTLRHDLASAIRAAPLRVLEEMGHRHSKAISDLAFLSNTSDALVASVQHMSFLLFMSIIIALISFKALLIWIATLGLITWQAWHEMLQLHGEMEDVSDQNSRVHARVEDMLDGFVQLKLDARIREELTTDIDNARAELCRLQLESNTTGDRMYMRALLLFFTVGMGVSIFAPESTIGLGAQLAYEMVTLLALAMGPLFGLMQELPLISKAEAAATGIVEVLDELRAQATDGDAQVQSDPDVQTIELQDLTFSYGRDGSGFEVGPVNLTLRRGELTFVTGGNGSGKTTLMNMLLGLYPAHTGKILWDGRFVGPMQLSSYQNLFSAIFYEQHLFDRLYGLADHVDSEQVLSLLRRFGIDHVTDYDGVSFSNLSLSSGQRMRLAMVVAMLEDRPVCLFDEWTANQDPQTTWYYYDTLLPELLAAGKMVIAVSHDERFFERADHLVQLQNGKVVINRRKGSSPPDEPEKV